MLRGMVRENKFKVFILAVISVFTAFVFVGAVLNYLNDEPLDLMPLYGCLILVFLCGSVVALANDKFHTILTAIIIRRKLRTRIMGEETKVFEALVGKDVLVVMAAGGSYKGRVDSVEGNWMKLVDKKHGEGLVNTDLISSISVLPQKTEKPSKK